jgi:hypothetical protein
MHHNGLRNRYKVRERHYLTTGERFLEIKHKTNKGRTIKERILLNHEAGSSNFPQEKLPAAYHHLTPTVRSYYKRISLLSKNQLQRLTLDLGLAFSLPDGSSTTSFDKVVIAELKQPGYMRNAMVDSLRHDYQLRKMPLSKYCIGCCLYYPFLKQNAFKPMLIRLRKFQYDNL